MITLLLLLACDPEPADTGPACDTGPTLDWRNFGDGFFTTYCRACHSEGSPDRHRAPIGLDFDTEAQVRMHASRIEYMVLESAQMPVGGGVYPEDLMLLDLYLTCGLESGR